MKRAKGSTSRSEQSIVIASNRLPFTFSRTAEVLERKRSPGGLVSALEPILRERGGTWIDWLGRRPQAARRDGGRRGAAPSERA